MGGPRPDRGGGRAPCLVGTARRTWHPGEDPAPEPLDMWDLMARAACDDAAAGLGRHGRAGPTGASLLAGVDDLGVVHCQTWAYDDPAGRLAHQLRLRPGHRTVSILAGTSPQRLLNAAAERMLRGETRAALVVGGEALATRRGMRAAGEEPAWRFPHPTPPSLPVDLAEWYLPTEVAHGVLPAWLTFALLEQARWAARGATSEDRGELGRLMAHLARVAATNPDAWFREPLDAHRLVTPAADNRMVATPYTKRVTAFMDVDMAAGHLLVTEELADQWGVPPERRVHLRGWGFARDATHLGARSDLTASPAMRAATVDALRGAGMGLDDVDVFDLYSCFGSAVQFARDALGLAPGDARPTSLTGGLPYHGGPSSNYMSHSISHLVDHLRDGRAGTGLVTGVGMHMTKHVTAVWATEPGTVVPPDTPATLERVAVANPDVPVVDRAEGVARVLAATAVHDRQGAPDHAVALCELGDGRRCYARSAEAGTVALVGDDGWVDRKAELRPAGDGTNELRF